MSFRSMLKVSFLMLLAMTLAATSAHARLDLFGQLLTSKNQPDPNYECQKIPFLLCGRICDSCTCDRRAPELAECTCSQWKPFAALQKSDEAHVQVIEKEKSAIQVQSSGTIPYAECIKTCDKCFCTLRWPPESNVCFCGDNKKSKKPVALVQEAKMSSSNVKSEIMPYSECQKNCKHVCACTLIWPPELSTCICGDYIKSSANEAAEELHKELDLVSKPVAKSVGGFIPYPECIEKCDECVICTKPYPIELALCYCGKKTDSDSKKPAIEYAEKVLTELDIAKPVAKSVGGFIPYPECIEKCDECVICTFIYPIEAALCYCGKKTASNSKKPAIEYAEKLLTELAVAKPVAKSVGGFIPYPECIEKCDECTICTLIYPIEKALCYCGKKTEAEGRALPI
ncbi:uncharacterized protein LOC121048806 isoform X4 [Rosa chinensis]|uniref:uncharacterized protein LOC121048806 isoform X4 n=1 Tax=Rosa chinensis TaxID=74649 RepID=UPI001AD8BCB6|nr:uncharacterized protein LOC121048806 isoform X4 [Rosa chinensis]